MTDAEIFHEAIVTPRDAFVPLPDLRIVDRPGWRQLVTPSFRDGGFNEVALAVLAPGEADRVIDETIAEYRALGIRFRWVVAPDSSPPDLADRLARRGLASHEVWAMAKRLEPGNDTQASEHVHVEPVDEATLETYVRVMAEGWNVDPAPLVAAQRLALATGTRHSFLARVDGEPAATTSYAAFPRSAYLIGGVTLPRFRKRGCYRALVAARLADALARGIPLATSHARATTSGPLLERLGFHTVATFPSFSG